MKRVTRKRMNKAGTTEMPRNNKRLLYVASNMRHINNFHTEYIAALKDSGYSVSVMARGEGADFDIPFEKKLFSPKNTACRKKIRKIIKENAFDAIILNTSLAAFHVRLACPIKNKPKIVNIVHGYLFSKEINPIKRLLLLFCEIIMRGKTDVVVTMNQDDYETANKFKLAKDAIYQSRGMGATLRPEITPPEKIRKEYFNEGDFVMTFVGELSGRKNQSFLIDALAKIKKDVPSAKLCLVGEGAEREALAKRAEALSLEKDVIFTGNRPDACDFIRACDLYVSASTIEGLPFNLVEAMGAKKTLLVSKIKGHTDLVTEGESGFLFEFGNLDEFVEKVKKIYKKEFAIFPEKVYESHLKFEKRSVFPETLEIMKTAIK